MTKIQVGIYAFTSKVNGFCYVGQSINLAKRKREHLKDLRNGNHHAIHLQRHYSAHGVDCLDYCVLEFCTLDLLTAREQFWMNAYEATGSFNSIPASDSAKGFSPSVATRLKLSVAGKGKKRTLETKELMKISNSRPSSPESIAKMIATRKENQAGKPPRTLTDVHKEILRQSRIGSHHTKEARQLMGAASAGRIFSDASILKMRIAATGRTLTESIKAKISAANTGLKRTFEMRERMSEQRKGRKPTPEAKANSAAACKGYVKTLEHMEKIAASRLRNKLEKLAA
jgi:group I intron endonuclease